eukprot:scaffold21720_cov126-Isochrysis_galbana.AAC.4
MAPRFMHNTAVVSNAQPCGGKTGLICTTYNIHKQALDGSRRMQSVVWKPQPLKLKGKASAATSSKQTSSAVRRHPSASTFSSIWVTDEAPAIGKAPLHKIQLRATCAGVLLRDAATSVSTASSGRIPPGATCPAVPPEPPSKYLHRSAAR